MAVLGRYRSINDVRRNVDVGARRTDRLGARLLLIMWQK